MEVILWILVFSRIWSMQMRQGIPVGVYFYSTAQNEAQAVQDAQFVIRSMKGYLVSYPVVIDLEDSSQAHLSKQQIGRIAKLTAMRSVRQVIRRWCIVMKTGIEI